MTWIEEAFWRCCVFSVVGMPRSENVFRRRPQSNSWEVARETNLESVAVVNPYWIPADVLIRRMEDTRG